MTAMFLVMSPGPFTTVQDKGRFGYQYLGVPVSGALDAFSFHTANLLVGNPKERAVLEMTVVGAQFAVMQEADVALTGANMEMKLNSKPIESWQSLRVLPGPQHDRFKKGLTTFLKSEYVVSPQADRMGLRLIGPPIAQNKGLRESIISEPTMPGSIQIPADSQPIILLSEQTVGGYAKIATVISADIPKVAQAKPGDSLRFERVSLEHAHAIYRQEAEKLRQIENLLARQ